MMDELLNEYEQQFNEPFPLMMAMGMNDEEVMKTIKSCIKDGKPYEPKIDDNSVV